MVKNKIIKKQTPKITEWYIFEREKQNEKITDTYFLSKVTIEPIIIFNSEGNFSLKKSSYFLDKRKWN